jgi:hypothetical protein
MHSGIGITLPFTVLVYGNFNSVNNLPAARILCCFILRFPNKKISVYLANHYFLITQLPKKNSHERI